MIRGNRLILNASVLEGQMYYCQSFQMDGKQYIFDKGQRMEFSLQECEAIIAQLPLIVEFVIQERPKEVKK